MSKAETRESTHVQLKKGVLELCVLAVLARGDSYAYELASLLAGTIDMSEGTIYPLMRRLQSEGLVDTYLVESQSGPSRKYYRLTPTGRKRLANERATWIAFSMAVETLLEEKR